MPPLAGEVRVLAVRRGGHSLYEIERRVTIFCFHARNEASVTILNKKTGDHLLVLELRAGDDPNLDTKTADDRSVLLIEGEESHL